jgi:2-oxoglutarate dehydrogenase E2 component (dihydrolipoamide succinyltransferase)
MVSVTMPRLGESVEEGTVTRWLKSEGEHVDTDEPLLEVSTDKVDTEVPSPASGTLAAIKVGEDQTVDVGEELATIEEGGAAAGDGQAAAEQQAEPQEPTTEEQPAEQATPEPAAEAQPAEQAAPGAEPEPQPEQPEPQPEQPAAEQPAPEAAEKPQRQAPQQPSAASQQPPAAGDGQAAPYVTPLVRKLAAEQNVDLSAVTGTGVGGRIRKQDVLQAAGSGEARQGSATPTTAPSAPAQHPPARQQAPQSTAAAPAEQPRRPAPPAAAEPAPAPGRTEKLSRLRKIIAERMTESLRTSAQLTTVVEADITRIAQLRGRARDDFERREGVKLSFLPFFAAAACDALKAHPAVNASLDADAQTVTYHDGVHLGIAVDTDRGLLVPVIHGAGDLNLGGLARKIADLAERSRSNRIGPDELSGGTFTVTNIGSRGALLDTPIINQPQVGILGTGAVVKRPVVVEDPALGEVIAVRSMAYLVLTYDHRLIDGADAARFVGTIKDRLEDGAFEGDLGLS